MSSEIYDINKQEIRLGDTLKLTFNQDSPSQRHEAIFDVVWKDAAYKIISQNTKGESFLGSVSYSVKIEIVKSAGLNKCPKCEGKGKISGIYPEMGLDANEPPKTWEKECILCKGKGEIDDFTLGLYNAHGSKAVVKARGFA